MIRPIAVLDVGKSNTKLSLVEASGAVTAVRSRANAVRHERGLRVLDTDAIEAWAIARLGEFAREREIGAIVPVAHGATAALVEGDSLAAPVLDYEFEPPAQVVAAYRAQRDPFARALSPALPQGLNLGVQLFWQEQLYPEQWPKRAQALLWPQYWAWRLSGVCASEVTSLGCHTDLWYPLERGYSDLARHRGWDRRFPPIFRADAPLGTVRPDIADAMALPRNCEVLCGIHDSNASLVAARAMKAVRGTPFTLVSTGTWFVALQSGANRIPVLDAERDTLANVDIDANPTASARFMGGREYEALCGNALGTMAAVADAERLVARGAFALPSFVEGCGPFPRRRARIEGKLQGPVERASLASLYLALMTDTCLDLIAAEGPVLIEGRFANDAVFASALASLRPSCPVFRCSVGDGIALGAACLNWPDLALDAAERVPSLPFDLAGYRQRWRAALG